MERKGKSSANAEKGKQPACSSSGKQTEMKEKEAPPKKSASSSTEILDAIKAIQSTLVEQSKTLLSQDEVLKGVNNRLVQLENYDEYYDESMQGAGCDYGEVFDNTEHSESVGETNPEVGEKRKLGESSDSRFVKWAKRFKSIEPTSEEIDSTLANTVTELFRNGIEDKKYNDMISDENVPRPINCEGLVTVKMNSLIWDSVSASARARDSKLQKIETSVVKAAVMLTKMVNKMAKVESSSDQSDLGEFIDVSNDVLALMGQANKQINLTRKDLLRPELAAEYSHLCNHNRPVSEWLFGDDVSKSAKEIEDCSKISGKIFKQPHRGRFSRGRLGARGSRGAGTSRGHYNQGYNPAQGYQNQSTSSKNFRRGFGQSPQRRR